MSTDQQVRPCTEQEQPMEPTLGHDAVIAGSRLEGWLKLTYKGEPWPPIIWAVDISRLSESEVMKILAEIGTGQKFVLVPQTDPHLRVYVLNSAMRDHIIGLCLGRGTRTVGLRSLVLSD